MVGEERYSGGMNKWRGIDGDYGVDAENYGPGNELP
jgi:hypothetical protein